MPRSYSCAKVYAISDRMKNDRLFGGILLIAGTTIGAGMLALPLSTGIAGFFPALLIFSACFLLMYWSGCLFLEMTLSFEKEVNLITMAKETLGKPGEALAWAGFLLLLYTLLSAYLAGSGPYFSELWEDIFNAPLPAFAMPFPLVLVFGPFLYFGLHYVDVMNRYLMMMLVASFALMVTLLAPEVQIARLAHVDMSFALISFAVVVTSFGYHIIIPSLTTYLRRDVKAVKRCIFWGSSIPLGIYILWEVLILGNIPVHGASSLAALIHPDGPQLSGVLESSLQSSWIARGMRAFALFAIITSFLGVAQSLFDFLRDGVKAPNSHRGRALVWLLTFVPPLVFVLASQQGFVAVIEYAGVFIAILVGLVPIMMTWSGRYIKKLPSPYRAVGGKPALIAGFVVYVAVVVLSMAKNLGVMNLDLTPYMG
jgi:tyrosine-specific transport protein